jgi:uncharacterized protein
MEFKKIIGILFLILILSGTILAAGPIRENSSKIFAVTTDKKGTMAQLEVKIIDGEGEIWSRVSSLVGLSTQNTEKTVVNLAKTYVDYVEDYDYQFHIMSDAEIVDGPSAGLPTGLLLISMLQGKKLPSYVSATGTISTSGHIGKVGGVLEKTKKAAENGIKLFLIPQSETDIVIKDGEVKKVDLREYAYDKWNIKVVGVTTLDDALELAFTDLDDIVIEGGIAEDELLYNPPETEFSNNLDKFYDYIGKYKTETRSTLDAAKTALNNTTLEDNDMINYLFENLTYAENGYEDGNIAYDKNYLYSAANYFFLANIYANMAKDVAENPQILNLSSTDLRDKITVLATQIGEMKAKVDYVPIENYEWNIAAKERLLWAEKYLKDLDTVEIMTNGDIDDSSLGLSKIKLYEFAKEWKKIASMFIDYSPKMEKELSSKAYEEAATEVLKELDDAQEIINQYQITDIDRRIYGAREAFEKGWYFTSIFESASTLAIINSTIETNNKEYEEIKEMFEDEIEDLGKKLENTDTIWSNLYFDHSVYYYNAALFYEKEDRMIDALENVKSGYQLISLANYLLDTTEDIERNKKAITKYTFPIGDVNGNEVTPITGDQLDYALLKKITLALLILLLIVSIIAYAIFRKYKQTKVYDSALDFTNYHILRGKEMMLELDKKFINNKLDIETHKKLTDKYREELQSLEEKKKGIISTTEEIETLESDIKYLNDKLDNTTTIFKKGLITNEEYHKRITKYKKEINEIKYDIKKDEDKIIETLKKEDEEMDKVVLPKKVIKAGKKKTPAKPKKGSL